MDNTKKDLLSAKTKAGMKAAARTNRGPESGASLTCGHRANQDGAELDDRAEDALGVGGAGLVLAVELEEEPLVLLLQQHQDVLQEDHVELWKKNRQEPFSSWPPPPQELPPPTDPLVLVDSPRQRSLVHHGPLGQVQVLQRDQ